MVYTYIINGEISHLQLKFVIRKDSINNITTKVVSSNPAHGEVY